MTALFDVKDYLSPVPKKNVLVEYDEEFIEFLQLQGAPNRENAEILRSKIISRIKLHPQTYDDEFAKPLRIFLWGKVGVASLLEEDLDDAEAIYEYFNADPVANVLQLIEPIDSGISTPAPKKGGMKKLSDSLPDIKVSADKGKAVSVPVEANQGAVDLTSSDFNSLYTALNSIDSDLDLMNLYECIKYKGYSPEEFTRNAIVKNKLSLKVFKMFAFIGAFTNNVTKMKEHLIQLKTIDATITFDGVFSSKNDIQSRNAEIKYAYTFSRFTSVIPAWVAYALYTIEWPGVYQEDACDPCLQFFGAVSLPLNSAQREAHKKWAEKHSTSISSGKTGKGKEADKKAFNEQLYDMLANRKVNMKSVSNEIKNTIGKFLDLAALQ
jgi:hypothetical protein